MTKPRFRAKKKLPNKRVTYPFPGLYGILSNGQARPSRKSTKEKKKSLAIFSNDSRKRVSICFWFMLMLASSS
jgi:hypothetical protein